MLGLVALDNQVNVRDQLPEQVAARRGFQVEGYPLLVQVQDQEEQALLRVRVVMVVRPYPPHGRPARRLHFQHVGAVVGQQPSAKRPGDVLAQVQYLQSVKNSIRHGRDFIPTQQRRQFDRSHAIENSVSAIMFRTLPKEPSPMQENKVRRALRENRLALGTYVTFADPQVVEIIGLAGFDAAFIDMEHTTFDLGLVSQMIVAADLAGVTSMIRIPGNDENLILRLLDAGAQGIIIPHIDGLEGGQAGRGRRALRSHGTPGRRRRHPGGPFRHRQLGRTHPHLQREHHPVRDDRG